MSRRIFVALPLSRYMQDEISAWGDAHSELPVRYIEGPDLHVTLVPPWYELMPEKTIENLATVPTNGSFELGLKEVGLGPDLREPRLIWATGEPPMKLLELKLNIEQALGLEVTLRQPYLMHVTMARFPAKNLERFPSKRLRENVDWRDEVDKFVLMETVQSPAGFARYDILAEFKL